MTNRASLIVFSAALLLCSAFVESQVSVAIAPDPHPQFLDGTGKPLASGFLYTYQAGTTTLLNTYVDSGGNVQNPDPIPLDATGSPSNGSTQTGIWLANTSYKFCAYSAALVQQWCADNVTGYLGLLNLANTWTFGQTFSLPIIDTAIDNQFVLGSPGNQTTLDFPPPTGNVTLHFPNTGDTMVGRATTDTLTNKTLTNPSINGVVVTGGNTPGALIQNASVTGTTLNTLTSIFNTGGNYAAVITPAGATGGVIGITTVGAGTTGSATVVFSGGTQCVFDNAVTGGDYVQISTTVAGNCHDVGASYPTSGQVIGRSAQTFGVAGTYGIDLFGSEIHGGPQVLTVNTTPVTSHVATMTLQTLQTSGSSFTTPLLNQAGRVFTLKGWGTFTVLNNTTTISLSLSLNGGAGNSFTFTPGSTGLFSWSWDETCTAQGSTNYACYVNVNIANGSTATPTWLTGADGFSAVTITPLGLGAAFSTSSATNSITEAALLITQLN